MQKNVIPEKISQEPITLPQNPFWNVFRTFGRDELIAFSINVGATGIISLYVTNTLALIFAGPVLEKIGFFPAHFKEAFDIYRTTPLKRRKPLLKYCKTACKNASKSLIDDILLHDPCYVIILALLLFIYAGMPAWIASALSFLLAIAAVAIISVIRTEIAYLLFKQRFYRRKFQLESYVEARFYISSKIPPQKIIDMLAKELHLQKFKPMSYEDTYFEHEFPEFSGRKATVRLRKRTNIEIEGAAFFQTAQIVYTRAQKYGTHSLDQYRFFPIQKEKLYFELNQKMPQDINDIENERVKKILLQYSVTKPKTVVFKRYGARSTDLLITADELKSHKSFYLVELKIRKDFALLIRAMRLIMLEFPVVQITHSKSDISVEQ